jgi:RNA polymerase sigma-70 factor, ECF subfamily
MRKKSDMICELTIEQYDHDAELVRAARDGSRDAFDILFNRHKRFVYNVCYRMLGSRDDAVDATQTAFIQAYRALNRFRGDSAFRSWLYRIAVNSCTGMLRQELRQRQKLQEINPDPPHDEPRDDVWEAILQLCPDMRAALVLFYFEGLNGVELAQALGCSDGAARTRLHRARIAFKRKYEEIKR